MKFIFLFLLPVIVMAKSNSTKNPANLCFRDLIVLKNIGTELSLLYFTAGCNVLLLGLNAAILYAVLGYMKPTISEIRKQTFIIMDNLLISYIPSVIREKLGCKAEVGVSQEDKKSSTGKGKKSAKSTTSTGGTTKTGTTGAASE